MKLLVACEESQRVCTAFREKGHEAYSCDIIECSGGHPEWHIKADVLPLLNGNCKFTTMDGTEHEINGKWDMIIAHPPCTYLTIAGTRHFSKRINPPEKIAFREKKRKEAFDFVIKISKAKCKKIVIENPVGYLNTHWEKPTQIIHPYFFAESEYDKENYVQKRTCLWLNGVSELKRTSYLKKPEPLYYCQGEKCKGKAIGWCEGVKAGKEDRAKVRSKTFPGIAKAMADQWG